MVGKMQTPAGWKVVRLGDVAKVVMGQSPPGETVIDWDGDFGRDDGLPFIQGNAEFGVKSPRPLKWCVQPVKVAYRDDLLISVRAPVGQTNRASEELSVGRGLAAIRFSEPSQAFGWHIVNHTKGALERVTQGSTFQAIGGEALRSLPILLPPLSEQQAIAAVWTPSTMPLSAQRRSSRPPSSSATPCSTNCSPGASLAGTPNGRTRTASGPSPPAGRWYGWGIVSPKARQTVSTSPKQNMAVAFG